MLQIKPMTSEEELVILFEGELDHHEAREAIDQTEDLLVLYPSEAVVLDLSGLIFMDSSGLAVAMHVFRVCARCGRGFAVRGTPAQPLRVFEAAGLTQIMEFQRG